MNANQDCLAYAEHLQVEHRELHARLRTMQAEMNKVTVELIDGPMLERMRRTGEQLRRDLAHHFAEEDSGGCLDYACSRVPGLTREAQELEREHPQLLTMLDHILDELHAALPYELTISQVKESFDAFVVRLLSHEARENRLVQRGFNLELD